jgi:hypothetical protein
VYTLAYLGWRWAAVRRRGDRVAATATGRAWIPGHGAIVAFTLAIAAATFVIRLRYPLDTWVPLLGFVQSEPARIASYGAFFTAGLLAARKDWVALLPASIGYAWLALGGALGALPFAAGGIGALGFDSGGATLRALAGAIYESFLCTSLCVGLLVLFRERLASTHALLRSLSASSYAVYILHVPIVVALQFAFAGANLPALLVFGVVCALAIPISFAVAEVLRRMPGFRSVL